MNTTKYLTWLFILQALIVGLLCFSFAIISAVLEFEYTKQDLIFSSIIMFLTMLICLLTGCLVIYADKVIKLD